MGNELNEMAAADLVRTIQRTIAHPLPRSYNFAGLECGKLRAKSRQKSVEFGGCEAGEALMARHESNREDLLREATALKRRVELRRRAQEPIVAGFRSDGALSVYVGGDDAYHFDPEGQLKRAYVEGHLFRSQGETLAQLARTRTERETQLIRTDLAAPERDRVLSRAAVELSELSRAVRAGEFEGMTLVPEGDDHLLSALVEQLDAIVAGGIRLAPAYAGRA
jgi:hypothetical protein